MPIAAACFSDDKVSLIENVPVLVFSVDSLCSMDMPVLVPVLVFVFAVDISCSMGMAVSDETVLAIPSHLCHTLGTERFCNKTFIKK